MNNIDINVVSSEPMTPMAECFGRSDQDQDQKEGGLC